MTKNLTDKELVDEYRSLYHRVEEKVGGYGTSDLRRYEAIKSELESRNIVVNVKLEFRHRESSEVIAG